MSEPTIPASPALAEDLLLVLFDPGSGEFAGESTGLFHTLAGAVLADLALQGRISLDPESAPESVPGPETGLGTGAETDPAADPDVDLETSFALGPELDERPAPSGRYVSAVAGGPPADPLLRGVWERLALHPIELRSMILGTGSPIHHRLVDRLVGRGHLRRERRRTFGLIRTTVLADGGTPRRADLLASVRAALADGIATDSRTRALAALLSASGCLPSLRHDIPWSTAVYARGRELECDDWAAAAAGEAVRRAALAVMSNNFFGSTSVNR